MDPSWDWSHPLSQVSKSSSAEEERVRETQLGWFVSKNHGKIEESLGPFISWDVPGRKLGSMVRINGFFHPNIHHLKVGYKL